jgi:aspartate kinase
MGNTTDELLSLAAQVSGAAHLREVDMLLAAGEQISIAMLTMALLDLGVPAVSLTGPQAGILTDRSHGKARIIGMRADRVAAAIERGEVPIVAGFQGLSQDQDVTTLGRGGSDTTAVALAAALGAAVCEIYTDVDGVYTADPRLVPSARKLGHVSYDEMLELAACGARVLMLRSVEYARRTGVRLHVRSSFGADEGTWVFDERGGVEHAIISGIAHDTSEAKVTLLGVPDQPGVAAAVLRPLAEASVNVDMIVQNVSGGGDFTDITFTVTKADLERAMRVLAERQSALNFKALQPDPNVVKVSVIGVGMRSHAGIAQRMFQILAEKGINIQVISTSEIKISVLIAEEYTELAVRSLHTAYGLDAQ